MPVKQLSALEKAMRMLSIRSLSETELKSKLLSAAYPEDEVDKAVEECRKYHYIDDHLLAEDCVELLRQRNSGSRLIRQKLIKRGLAAELSDGLPEKNSADAEEAAAIRALEYKLRLLTREKDIRKKRERVFRYLTGRGFSAGLIFKLIARTDLATGEFDDENLSFFDGDGDSQDC